MSVLEKAQKMENKINDIDCSICKYCWECDGDDEHCQWRKDIEYAFSLEDD